MKRPEKICVEGAKLELAESLELAAELIRAHDSFLVASHEGPDGDAVGSTLGLCLHLVEQGKRAVPYLKDQVPYNFRFLKGVEWVIDRPSQIPEDVEVLIVLDCSSLMRVDPKLARRPFEGRLVCVDHHQSAEQEGFDAFVHDPSASSVGEILYRLLHTLDKGLSLPVAECLYTSIYTDTGGFRYQNTTSPGLAIAAQLVALGVDVWKITSEVYENHPQGRVRLLGEVLRTLRLSSCGRFAFLTVSGEMYQRTGSGPDMLDGFINFARGIRGVEVACQLREVRSGQYRVSFRSRGTINVAELAGRFNGGGHHNAAGCTVRGEPESIIELLSSELGLLLASFESNHP